MKHKILDWLGTVCLVVALFLGVNATLSVSGCETGGDSGVAQAAYDEAVMLVDASAATALELRAMPDRTPEQEAMLAKAEATIMLLQEKLAAALDAEGNLDEVKGLQIITDFIPPPYNVQASLLIGTFGAWLKGRKTRVTFKKLVNAINIVKKDDPVLASALASNKTALATAMGPKATAVLTAARKDGVFPVA